MLRLPAACAACWTSSSTSTSWVQGWVVPECCLLAACCVCCLVLLFVCLRVLRRMHKRLRFSLLLLPCTRLLPQSLAEGLAVDSASLQCTPTPLHRTGPHCTAVPLPASHRTAGVLHPGRVAAGGGAAGDKQEGGGEGDRGAGSAGGAGQSGQRAGELCKLLWAPRLSNVSFSSG